MRSRKNPLIGLFTYGGGMRGLIPAHFMSRIEEVTGLRMADMVDIFSGPSTGAILNAALVLPDPDNPARPKYKARHLIRFYEREGRNIFPPDRFRAFRGLVHDLKNRTTRVGDLEKLMRRGHYDPANLARSLRDLYGTARLSDTLRDLIVPVYDIENEHQDSRNSGGHSMWLRASGKSGKALDHERNTRLFDAVMASCAAPTYFPCHSFRIGEKSCAGIDGSVFDNPCVSYFGAIRPHLLEKQPFVYVLLGTGATHRTIRGADWNRYGPIGVVDPVNDLPLIKILFQATESALWESFSSEIGENLFVFDRPLNENEDDPDDRIDNAEPENLKKLIAFSESLIEENRNKFDALCQMLVKNRDARTEKQATRRKTDRKLIPVSFRKKKGSQS